MKDQKINAYMQVMDFFELDFEDIGNDKTKFLSLFEDEDGKESLLSLCFAKEGKVDSLGDGRTYLEINGERIYLSDACDDFSINDLDVSSVSFDLKETEGTLSISVEDLTFTANTIAPVEHSIAIRMSVNAFFPVEKYKENNTAPERWVYSYEGLQALDVTMDGDEWPHFEFEPMKNLVRYGDYERFLGYTVSFESNGGSSVDPIIVGFGDSIDISNLPIPTKEDYPFKEWLTEDGEPVDEYFNLTEDITLYACYFDEEAPGSLEGEIFSMYKLACLIKENALEKSSAGGERPKIQELFSSETAGKTLLDMLLFLKGETDSFGSKSYITIGGKRYDEDFLSSHTFADGAISGGGFASYSDNSENSTKPTYKRLRLDDLSYYVIIDSNFVRVDNFYAELETWYEEGRDEYYAIALTIKDRSVEEVCHSFKLFRNTNKGVYDDYYFDSTRYNQTT